MNNNISEGVCRAKRKLLPPKKPSMIAGLVGNLLMFRYGLVNDNATEEEEEEDEVSGSSYATAHSSFTSLSDVCKICHCGSEVMFM